MQELKEWVNTELKLLNYEHPIILAKIDTLLEKEKEQILDAVAKGRKQKVENGFWGYTYTPEEIYNQCNQNM